MEIDPIRRALRRSVWALSAASLFSLMLTRELGAMRLAVIPLAALALYWRDERGRARAAPRMETAAVLAALALSVARFFLWKHNFVLLVADFLVAFLFVKGAFAKDMKDLRQMTALSFFILLAGATLALDFTFLLIFLTYAALAAWTLSLFPLVEMAPSAPPEDRKLAPIARVFVRTAAVTLACSVVLALIMFIFFPRWSAAVFQGVFLGPIRQTGFAENISLEGPGQIYKDPRVVMRVETVGANWDGYLRGAAMPHFNGKRWTADDSPPSVLRGFRVIENRYVLSPPLEGLAPLHQRIYLEAIDSRIIFAAPWAARLEARLPRLMVSADGALRRPPGMGGRISYSVFSYLAPRLENRLAGAARGAREPAAAAAQAQFLGLPESGFGRGRLAKLARSVVGRTDDPAVKARRLAAFLRKDYAYSLDGEADGATHPIESFLFDKKRGHCEYFASALAVLLRLEGVPARLVTGFRAHERNPDGGYYVVRAQDAHAWVEAQIDGQWTMLDPTPGARFTAADQNFWSRMKSRLEYLNFLWNARVLGYDLEAQQKLVVSAYTASRKWDETVDRRMTAWREKWENRRPQAGGGRWTWLWGAGVGLSLAAFFLRRRRRGRRFSTATWFYAEALARLSRAGFSRGPGETPKEFLIRFPGRETARAALALLTGLFYRVRFGARPLSPTEADQARRALKLLKAL